MSQWELSPGPGNPRNSEGAFLRLRDGGLLFCYSAFRGDAALDHTSADIAVIRSADDGRTWSAPETLFRASDHGAMNVMSVSLLRMQNGDIGIFYLVRMSWMDMRVALRRSADEGGTWGAPVLCTPRPDFYVMNNDRAVRLSSGRIVLPMADHPFLRMEGDAAIFAPARAAFFYSDDDGATWREAAHTIALPMECSGLQEPGLLETADHQLYGWARTNLGCQYAFASSDGALHWGEASPGAFPSPLSPLSMKRLLDGRLLALWNPVCTPNADPRTGGRTPLVFALSADEGRTWSAPRSLEDDPLAGYCYTAIFPMSDAVLLAYCAGDIRRDASCLNRLRIRRVPLATFDAP